MNNCWKKRLADLRNQNIGTESLWESAKMNKKGFTLEGKWAFEKVGKMSNKLDLGLQFQKRSK